MGYQEDMAQAGRLIRDYDGTGTASAAKGRPHARRSSDRPRHRPLHIAHHARRHAYDADPANYTQSLLLARLHRAAKMIATGYRHCQGPPYLSVGRDDRRAVAGSPDQSMHEKTSVPALIEEITPSPPGRRPRTRHALPRPRRRAQEGDEPGRSRCRPRSTIMKRTSCRSSPTSTQASAMPRRCTAKKMIEAALLRAANREPGFRRKAVRPPRRQGHRAARGFHREDPRCRCLHGTRR